MVSKIIYKLVFSILILMSFCMSQAQTYLSPVIGVGFSEIQTNMFRRLTNNDGYAYISPIIGFNIQQQLNSQLYLTFNSTISYNIYKLTKKRPVYPFVYIPKEYISLPLTVGADYFIDKNFYVGLGFSMTFYNYLNSPVDFRGIGYKAQAGYFIKNFFLQASYRDGLSYSEEFYLYPINTINLSFGYRFKLTQGRMRK